MTRRQPLPLVSIIIPVYNGGDFLRQAIDSALAQSYANVEVLVVNDGSSDDGETERIARGYGDRIRYLAKQNGGVATALNLGIAEMRGEYFSWLSHDDVYHPAKVEAQVAAAAGMEPDTVVVCAYELIDEHSRLLPGESPVPHDSGVVSALAASLNGCALLIPRRCFTVAGGFDPALRTTQDSDMWLRIALAGFRFAYLPRVLVQSRQHAQQGSRTIDTHAAERTRWYLAAVESLSPAVIATEAADIGEILIRRRQRRAFMRFVGRHTETRSLAASALLSLRLGAAVAERASTKVAQAVPRLLGRRAAGQQAGASRGP